MSAVLAYHGGCHCGALRVTFESAKPPADLQRRACQCSFCRSHGAVTLSDAEGAMRIDAEADALVRYRFGLKTADFLICARCAWPLRAIRLHAARQSRALHGAPRSRRLREAQATLKACRGVHFALRREPREPGVSPS